MTMNPEKMSDQNLLVATEKLVQEERELLTLILRHLHEIERRRLFCDLGFSSLFAYTTEKLGYSEDQAWRRISAIKLIKVIPAAAAKIESGTLSLSNAATLQTFICRQQKIQALSSAEKNALLAKLENKSTREVARLLAKMAKLAPEPIKPDKIKDLNDEMISFTFSAPRHLAEKLRRLRGLKGHAQLTMAELIEKLADLALKEWDPGRPLKRAASANQHKGGSPQKRRITSSVRREVWRRDQGPCVNCKGQHALEIDHQMPVAMGGESTLENLRLLCRTCNQRAAIAKLGVRKMAPYLERRS